jgi:hypothetical protein
MCFYDVYKFECGDWKWGNFRQHCNKEYRMGETCGMKLTLENIHQPTKCRLCEKYDTKLRKRKAECDRIERWQKDGKNPASVEKSYANIASLDEEIRVIYDELSTRRNNIGRTRPQEQAYYGHY